MLPALERQDDAILLRRGDPREYIDFLHHLGQRRIGHFLQLAAQDNPIARQANLLADVLVTSSLSPVTILTCTPSSLSFLEHQWRHRLWGDRQR